jgi:outer membrane protein assembly factor BamB
VKGAGVAEKAGVAIVIVLGVGIAVVRLTRPRAAAPHTPETSQANVPTPSAKGPVLAARGPVPTSAPVATAPPRMAHGDRHRTHRAKGRGPARITVGWKTQVGGAIQAQVTVSPDGNTLYAASLGGDLTALARDTGAIRWKLALGDRAYGAPCVADDGTIYVGSDAKRFYSVTPAGAVKWKLELDDEADTAAALTSDGKIVFTAGRTLYAVRSGGDVAWRFQAKKKIFTAPAIADDGTIAFGAQDHRAYRVTSQGVLASVTDLGADVDGSPAIGDDGAVFFGTDEDRVVRLGDAGEVVWRAPVGGFVRGGLSVARDGDVLAGVYGPTPRAVRLDAHDGGIVGSHFVQGTGAREFGVHGGALEDDDGTLYFGAQDDAAYAVERTGAVRWRFVTGDDVDAPLTLLADGALVVPSDDGIVYLLSP